MSEQQKGLSLALIALGFFVCIAVLIPSWSEWWTSSALADLASWFALPKGDMTLIVIVLAILGILLFGSLLGKKVNDLLE